MLDNASQPALFRLYGDVLEQGARGRSNVASNFLGGPVIGDLNEAIGAGISAYHGDLKPLEKGAVRRVPLVGPGLVDLLFKKDNSGLTKVP